MAFRIVSGDISTDYRLFDTVLIADGRPPIALNKVSIQVPSKVVPLVLASSRPPVAAERVPSWVPSVAVCSVPRTTLPGPWQKARPG